MKRMFTLWCECLFAIGNDVTSDAGKNIIENDWKSAGISDAVPEGLRGLDSLDSIDLLVQESENMLFYQSECVGLNILFRDEMKQTMLTMNNEQAKKEKIQVAIFSKKKPEICFNYQAMKMNKKCFNNNIYFLHFFVL